MTQFPFYPPDVRNRLERAAAEYTFVQDEPTPWSPLRHDLAHCRASLVSTAGLRLKTGARFEADRAAGSAEARELSTYVAAADVAFDFAGFDPRAAQSDLNVVAPADRLKELVDRRVIGGVGDTFFSFYGRCGRISELRTSAAEVARRLRQDHEVDVAFVIPASFECNQTAGLVARELEAGGISTVTLSTVREVTDQVRVPRPLFINFPFGRTLGPAHAVALQRAIVDDLVAALKTMDRPGRMKALPYVWEGTLE